MMAIKQKEKPCKAIGKAKGFEGCGKTTMFRKYGLCNDCYKLWLVSTPEGKETLNKAIIVGKKKAEKEQKQIDREEKEKSRMELISPDQYRSKYVQPLINKIARLIDNGNPCIATGNFEGKMAGGHYTSVGSNRTICLHLHNIFLQSFHSNVWNGGDDKRYREGLINTFGEDYLNFVEGLKAHRPIKLSKEDLVDIKKKAQKIVNDLEKTQSTLTPKERISMRNTVNIELGIYMKEFCVFNLN